MCLYTGNQADTENLPDPPATELVNSAIVLFATALPLQSSTIQEGVLEQLATYLSSSSLQRDPGRRAAVTVNAAMALLGMLKVAASETIAESGDLKQPSVERTIEELLRVSKLHPCPPKMALTHNRGCCSTKTAVFEDLRMKV